MTGDEESVSDRRGLAPWRHQASPPAPRSSSEISWKKQTRLPRRAWSRPGDDDASARRRSASRSGTTTSLPSRDGQGIRLASLMRSAPAPAGSIWASCRSGEGPIRGRTRRGQDSRQYQGRPTQPRSRRAESPSPMPRGTSGWSGSASAVGTAALPDEPAPGSTRGRPASA